MVASVRSRRCVSAGFGTTPAQTMRARPRGGKCPTPSSVSVKASASMSPSASPISRKAAPSTSPMKRSVRCICSALCQRAPGRPPRNPSMRRRTSSGSASATKRRIIG